MTIRNAFDSLASETTLNALKAVAINIVGALPATLSVTGNFLVKVAESLPAGTNNIGKVTIANSESTLPVSLDTSNLASSDQINQLTDLTNALYDLIASLKVFGGARAADGSLRVNTMNQTLPIVTTVGSLINQAQLGGYATNTLVMAQQNMNSKSNVNNCTG
jgi:hypothetical protein